MDSSGSSHPLSELEVSTSSEPFEIVDSGWTQLSTITNDDIYSYREMQAKVSGGTGEVATNSNAFAVGWRYE
jgi:hypothetical protein